MSTLIKRQGVKPYVDLTVCFSGLSDEVSMSVPPIRYMLPSSTAGGEGDA